MTTSANDETKKTPVTTPPPSKDTGTGDAPKKRKRKRKKATTPASSGGKTPGSKATPPPSTHTHKATAHKETIPSVKATTGEEKNIGEEVTENKKPNLDIKSTTHMLPGIDNIHDYIARKKSPAPQTTNKKDTINSLTSPDGTELIKLPLLYALIPHAKGDHKLVYMKENEPAGLIEDPRKRTPGEMYVKNGRSIYMVTLTMKEHPTLKDSHNEPYDVWIIDSPKQLADQIEAIKSGMGGGENFGDILYPDDSSAVGTNSKEQEKEKNIASKENNASPSITENTEEGSIEATSKEKNETDAGEITNKDSAPQDNTGTTPDQGADIGKDDTLDENTISSTPVDEEAPGETKETTLDAVNDIDTINLDLPADEELPEPDIDSTLETTGAQEDTRQEIATESPKEPAAEAISLDGIQESEDAGTQSASSEEQNIELETGNKSDLETSGTLTENEEISNDIAPTSFDTTLPGEEEIKEEGMHFNKQEEVDISLPTDTTEEESSGRSLFGSVEHTSPSTQESESESTPFVEEPNEQSMFRQPQEEKQTTPLDGEEVQPITEKTMFGGEKNTGTDTSSQSFDSPTPMTGTTQEEPSSPEENTQNTSGLNLDELTIDEPTDGTIDLDALSSEPESLETSNMKHTEVETIHEKTGTKKSAFPVAIIIRVILFIVIVGALFLVRKVMFPAIKGTKPVDNTQITTGDISLPEEVLTGTTVPDEQTPPDEGVPIDDGTQGTVIPPNEDTPVPMQGLTLNELTEKLKDQQTEARKALNIAKLLENKQAIKFSLAAMLKAGNVLERIDTEPTITTDDVLQESQKIDRYLQEANKLIE